MRFELQRLKDELLTVQEAVASAEDVSRPATNGWTVAQVLEHLAKCHVLTNPRFEAALAQAPERTGDDPVRYSWLEAKMVGAMAGKGVKIPVPAIFEPGDAGPEAKAACLASIDALLRTIERADAKRLRGLKVASPVTPLFRLGFLPYLDGVVRHATYHRRQF